MCFIGPSALTVSITKDIESLSLIVQWDEVEDFIDTTFTLLWKNETDSISKIAIVTEKRSYTITGLILDELYTIVIAAFNMCGNGPEFITSIILSPDKTSTIPTITTNPTDVNSKCFKYVIVNNDKSVYSYIL